MELLAESLVDPVRFVTRVDLLRGLAEGEGALSSISCVRCRLGILEELSKLFVTAGEVGFVVTDSCRNGDIDLREEKLDPRRRAGDECNLSCELLHFVYCEGLARAVEGLEELPCSCHECWWYSHFELASVNYLSKYFVEVGHHHFLHFFEGNGVLAFAQVRTAEQNENGFDPCRHSLLNAGSIVLVYLGVDGVVDEHVLRG